MRLRLYGLVIALASLIACQPEIADKTELGAIPTATFQVIEGSTPNQFTLQNTTEGAFITQWDLGTVGSFTGETVEISIPFRGDYEVKMTTAVQGGSAEAASQTITVTEDDPSACSGKIAMLTDCSEKTWVLAPEPDAMHVGPNVTDTWWGNSQNDVTDRACHFNDEFTFRVNGDFEYDNLGDWWADEVSGVVWPNDLGLTIGCHASDEWPDKYKAWDSGVHGFNVTDTELTLTGTGAFMGLYKAGTDGEVDSPQPSTTYTVLELTEDRLTIAAIYSWGAWRFTFVPK